ncbi:MAG TPA: hypothetical protein VGB45_06840 [Abditibacterium sp.]|jgi:hypothetical protein
MSLSNMMRKAAGLLVEMPPETEENSEARAPLDMSDLPDLDLPSTARLPSSFSASPGALAPKSIEQIVREADGPNLDEVEIDAAKIAAPGGAPGGVLKGDAIDFAAIYRAANLPKTDFGAEQMLETLNSLPAELPLDTRRATVRAMLSTLGKATGATPETVVADASRKLAALESFESFMAKKTGESVAQSEKEIEELEKQIDAKRAAIQKSKNELLKISSGCEAESDKLDDVLEFFSLDVGASKYAPQNTATSPPAAPPPTSTPNPN